MLVTLPLPGRITQYFPTTLVDILQKFAFYTFACLLTIPWLFCVYRVIIVPLGRKKRMKHTLNEHSAPKIVVVMPVYKEPPDSLWTALSSVLASDYPSACIHVFVSFDGDSIDELYLKTIDRLGVPVTLKEFPKSIDIAYGGARVTISRFPQVASDIVKRPLSCLLTRSTSDTYNRKMIFSSCSSTQTVFSTRSAYRTLCTTCN